ncbi:hypothetical protein HDU98_011602, partial [Podochytrium sp. JEL0797]
MSSVAANCVALNLAFPTVFTTSAPNCCATFDPNFAGTSPNPIFNVFSTALPITGVITAGIWLNCDPFGNVTFISLDGSVYPKPLSAIPTTVGALSTLKGLQGL